MKHEKLKSAIVYYDYPLSRITSWRVGGRAEFFVDARTSEVHEILSFANERGLPITVIGRGSNILVSDSGVKGLVLCLRDSKVAPRITTGCCEVEAGFPMPKLARCLAREGWGGFEFMVGIPGTVGGGIAMNAGTHAFRRRELSDVLVWAEVTTFSGQVFRVFAKDLDFDFRSSTVLRNRWIVTKAAFRLDNKEDSQLVQARTLEHLAERKHKQPLTMPTAGSTFKNPDGEHSAGWYIERAGLKGVMIGHAKISEKHANWIENRGGASAADIRNLISLVISRVEQRFSLALKPEVQFIGDFTS